MVVFFFICLLSDGLKADPIVTAAKQIHLKNYPESFNPSILKVQDGFLLTFRYCPDRYYNPHVSYIGIVHLNDSLEEIESPQLLNTRTPNHKIVSQSEDARIFSHKGELYLIYNDNVDLLYPTYWDRRDMFMAKLIYHKGYFRLTPPVKLTHKDKYSQVLWQKNWVPFEWEGTLLITYSINPHEILYPNLANGTCYSCYETRADIPWNYGTLRGSTPPLLVDNEYLAFFHSGIYTASDASNGDALWHYYTGAYTFSPDPPFELTKISIEPIMHDSFYTKSNREKRVILPGGYAIHGNTIYLAYGKDDYEIWVALLDKEALMQSLKPIEK